MVHENEKIILIPDCLTLPADIEQDVFGSEYKILTPCAKHASEIDEETWRRADAILAWHELQYMEDIIEKLDKCKVIVRVGVGFDNVDLSASGEKGIYVCNVPDYGTNDVADHTMGLMLTLARGIYAYNEKVRLSESWNWKDAGILHRLTGANMGIIGLGRIGTATALRAMAFGMRVIFYDPYLPDGQDKVLNITRFDNLSDLLKQSDVVSIHCPLTEETRGMANPDFFNNIKQGAIFINTARGKIVDLDALYNALKSNHLQAAGMDVLPQEPPEKYHPLIQAWRNGKQWIEGRFIITPHAAFYNKESYAEMRKKAAEEAKRVLEGKEPKNCVNTQFINCNGCVL